MTTNTLTPHLIMAKHSRSPTASTSTSLLESTSGCALLNAPANLRLLPPTISWTGACTHKAPSELQFLLMLQLMLPPTKIALPMQPTPSLQLTSSKPLPSPSEPKLTTKVWSTGWTGLRTPMTAQVSARPPPSTGPRTQPPAALPRAASAASRTTLLFLSLVSVSPLCAVVSCYSSSSSCSTASGKATTESSSDRRWVLVSLIENNSKMLHTLTKKLNLFVSTRSKYNLSLLSFNIFSGHYPPFSNKIRQLH